MGLHWFYRSNSGNINFNRNPSMNMVFIFVYLSFQCLLVVFYSIFSRGYILVHILFFLFTDMWSFKNDTVKVCSVHLSFCFVYMGCSERIALKQVYYQGWNRSPAQVGCMRQVLRAGALGRPRGMGWGGRERWEGGSKRGTHVNPWLIHVNVWQNTSIL